MDSMLRRRVNSFSQSYGYDELSDGEQFERYAAYTFLHEYINDLSDNIDAVVMGGGDDQGVDIAAIIVNGALMHEPSEIKDAIQGDTTSRAKVVFAQVKSSERRESVMIAKFLSGVRLVTRAGVDQDKKVKLGGKLKDVADMLDTLAGHQDRFSHTKFPLELYYITTSESSSMRSIEEPQVRQELESIKALNTYDFADVQLAGRQEIDVRIQNLRGPQNVHFVFKDRLAIDTVDEDSGRLEKAYIGTLPVFELLKLLLTSVDLRGELRNRIFDDNVRQFVGNSNPVNRKIYETLQSETRGIFPVLNNGITIIASELNESSHRMVISGYQVVNGAQTCSQIARWYQSGATDEQLKTTHVPVKIIVSKDSMLRSQITIATNLQTAIYASDIQGASQKAKDVEEYFAASGADGLRYQRQRGEREVDFIKTRIFSTDALNRAVAAVVFGDAYQATRQPKSLTEEGSIIWRDYPVELFYLSAWILYQIESHFRRSSDDSSLKASKYYVASLVALALVPLLKQVHSVTNNEQKVAIVSNVGRKIVKSIQGSGGKSTDPYLAGKTDEIRSLISKACMTVRIRFSDVLSSEGEARSLRKDDVRHSSLYSELQEIFISLK